MSQELLMAHAGGWDVAVECDGRVSSRLVWHCGTVSCGVACAMLLPYC